MLPTGMKLVARGILILFGWRMNTENPAISRCVVIAAPHTSNWDFLLMLLFSYAFGLKIKWMGKSPLFVAPFGFFLRHLGGVPVERDRKGKLVASMIELFSKCENLMLVVPVEGTRGYTKYWKSGFYHIAFGAKVPILPTFLDYSRKSGGFGLPLTASGDFKYDMQILRDFYRPFFGRYPKNSGPIRLREENS